MFFFRDAFKVFQGPAEEFVILPPTHVHDIAPGYRLLSRGEAHFVLQEHFHDQKRRGPGDVEPASLYGDFRQGALRHCELGERSKMPQTLLAAVLEGRLLIVARGRGGVSLTPDEPADPDDPPLPVKEVVNAVVKPPSLVVVVKKFATPPGGARTAYTHPARRALTLTTDKPFDGKGTFTCPTDKVTLYTAATGGTEITFDGKDNVFESGKLNAGVTVWVEGKSPSGGLDDIPAKLTLSGGTRYVIGTPDTATLTSVEVTLDICKAPPAAGGAPVPLSQDDKIHVGRNLLVQNADKTFDRAQLIIQPIKPAAFTKNLILKAANAHVTVYRAENPTAAETALLPYTIATDAVGAGDKLWAEGVTVSGDMRDTGFTLGIQGIEDDGDRVSATAVEILLDLCKSRRVAAGVPDAMSAADKIHVGRFVHEQDAHNHHGRALLIVRKVKPAKFDGTLVLECLGAKTALYPNERPTGGEAISAVPHEFNLKAEKNEDKKLWVEGKAVSGALRDVEYRLRLKDGRVDKGDRALITVCKFTKIKATIKATPPNTPANSTAAGVALPANHTFETTGADESFTTTPPLVLVRNAQPDIKLELTAVPAGLPVEWDAVRNPLDHATIGGVGDRPTCTIHAANALECNLSADSKGSFRIRPFIDGNGTHRYDAGEPSIPLNLVLVNAVVHGGDSSQATTVPTPETITAGGFQVATGTWSTPQYTTAPGPDAMAMSLRVNLTGGGADGKLGLNKVFAGLQNQTEGYRHEATYTDNTVAPPTAHRFRFCYASNQGAATGLFGGTQMFQPGDPAPVLYAMPLLDSGRPGNGQGGETVTMSRSRMRPTAAQPAVGQRIEIWCIDSPRRTFPAQHPINASAVLNAVIYQHQFRANFVVWSNINSAAGATGDPADRVYSVVRRVPWTLSGQWTVDYITNAAAPTFVRTAYSVTSTGAASVHPVARAQDNAIEVRPPSGITAGIVVDTQ